MQMTGFGKTAVSALTAAGLLLMAAGGGWEQAWGLWNESTEAGRMKNVVLLEAPSPAPREATAEDSPPREEAAVRTLALAAEPERMDPAPDALPAGGQEQVVETTIEGGMRIKNETGYYVDAAALLAESTGTDLGRIAVETDKLLKNLPEGASAVSADDIEKNVGISREYSVFELTRALSYRQADKAVRIATRMGGMPRFALPAAVSALFTHFYRVLRHGLGQGIDVNPYFLREYDAAVRAYPTRACMTAISLLTEYDYKGKGGAAGEATPGELLVELVTKLLSI